MVLETENKFLTIENITASFTEDLVDLPWVMYDGRKLYIQPSGSAQNNDLNYTEKNIA